MRMIRLIRNFIEVADASFQYNFVEEGNTGLVEDL